MDLAITLFILGGSLPEGFVIRRGALRHIPSGLYIAHVSKAKIIFSYDGLTTLLPTDSRDRVLICGRTISEGVPYDVSSFNKDLWT